DADLTHYARRLVMAAEDTDGGAAAYGEYVRKYAAGRWDDEPHRTAARRAFASAVAYAVQHDGIDIDSLPWTVERIFPAAERVVKAAEQITAEAATSRSFRILSRADLKARPKPE